MNNMSSYLWQEPSTTHLLAQRYSFLIQGVVAK